MYYWLRSSAFMVVNVAFHGDRVDLLWWLGRRRTRRRPGVQALALPLSGWLGRRRTRRCPRERALALPGTSWSRVPFPWYAPLCPRRGGTGRLTARGAGWGCRGHTDRLPPSAGGAQGVDGAKQLAAQGGLGAAVPLEARAGVERGPVGTFGGLGLGDLLKLGHDLFQPLDPLVRHREEHRPRRGLVGRPGASSRENVTRLKAGSRSGTCSRHNFPRGLGRPRIEHLKRQKDGIERRVVHGLEAVLAQ